MQSPKSIIAIIFLVFLFSSNSLSQIWEKISDPPPGVDQFKFAYGFENGSYVQFIVGTDGTGAFKSIDDGNNWESIGLVGKILTEFLWKPNNEYFATASDGVFKTTDGGLTWLNFSSGLEGLFITDIVSLFRNDELGVGTVGNGAFHSTDGGETWQPFGMGLENKTVTSIEFIYNTEEDDGIYATTQDEGVWVLDIINNTWISINDGNNNLVGTTAIAGDSMGNLFLASSPYILISPSNPVFWVTDDEFDFANDIKIAADDKVYVSSLGGGVRYRNSNGVWGDFSDGLPSDEGYIDVVNMEIDENGFVWVAVDPLDPTIIGGVYRTVSPVTDVKDNIVTNPDDFSLEQNYPNPFNPSTKISWQSPVGSHQTLKVYDVLGNEVATLVDEFREAGRYEIEFNASNLSSGIYFYKLQAENFVETKKMILLK